MLAVFLLFPTFQEAGGRRRHFSGLFGLLSSASQFGSMDVFKCENFIFAKYIVGDVWSFDSVFQLLFTFQRNLY